MKKTIILIIVFLLGITTFLFLREERITEDVITEKTEEIALELLADGFTTPVEFVSSYDGTGRMFLVDQIGVVKIINNQGEVLEDNFLDLRNRMVELSPNFDEKGLLGLAFHPDFKENGRFFVHYSAPPREEIPEDWNHTAVVSEFRVNESNANVADHESERIILQVNQPQFNHNGGHIKFGPDGYLYIPLGDGGGASDVGLGHPPLGNGQDITTLLGSILRIDIDTGDPYGIPSDNPFVGRGGRDEIFAYGLRNPYHISFDAKGNRELFAADVGQALFEEVNIIVGGGNYGWNIREGMHCFDPNNPQEVPDECPTVGYMGEPLIDPIFEYRQPIGIANVGGYIYRGKAIPGLAGDYVFGDWSTSFQEGDGTVFAASKESDVWNLRELKIANLENGRIGSFIKAVGQDEDGELYILTSDEVGPSGNTGKVFKVIPKDN